MSIKYGSQIYTVPDVRPNRNELITKTNKIFMTVAVKNGTILI